MKRVDHNICTNFFKHCGISVGDKNTAVHVCLQQIVCDVYCAARHGKSLQNIAEKVVGYGLLSLQLSSAQ